MVSSSYSSFIGPSLQILPSNFPSQHPNKIPSKISICYCKSQNFPTTYSNPFSCSSSSSSSSSSSRLPQQVFQKCCVPFAVSLLLFWSNPAQAGFLSGISGIESVPGPQLPSIDFLNRINEENQKKYAENDERIKSSPIIKELLERSKLNKEKNKQEIADKYCIRGAEWGVGDCSAEGMTPQEKDDFIAMLKKKAGVE